MASATQCHDTSSAKDASSVKHAQKDTPLISQDFPCTMLALLSLSVFRQTEPPEREVLIWRACPGRVCLGQECLGSAYQELMPLYLRRLRQCLRALYECYLYPPLQSGLFFSFVCRRYSSASCTVLLHEHEQ